VKFSTVLSKIVVRNRQLSATITAVKSIISCVATGALLLFCLRAAASDAIHFLNPDFQLGTVAANTNVPLTFVLTNGTDATVKIINADPSCECTTVFQSPSEIPAHAVGKFDLSFSSARSSGPVMRTFSVELADGQVITAQFTANVLAAGATNAAASEKNSGAPK